MAVAVDFALEDLAATKKATLLADVTAQTVLILLLLSLLGE